MWRCNRNSYRVTRYVPPLPVLYSTQHCDGAATLTRSKHPAILKFPGQADRISALMRGDKEFVDICRDYAQIVDDIARYERRPDRPDAVLADLLQLRSDLENDIVEKLSEAGEVAAATEQDPPT